MAGTQVMVRACSSDYRTLVQSPPSCLPADIAVPIGFSMLLMVFKKKKKIILRRTHLHRRISLPVRTRIRRKIQILFAHQTGNTLRNRNRRTPCRFHTHIPMIQYDNLCSCGCSNKTFVLLRFSRPSLVRLSLFLSKFSALLLLFARLGSRGCATRLIVHQFTVVRRRHIKRRGILI